MRLRHSHRGTQLPVATATRPARDREVPSIRQTPTRKVEMSTRLFTFVGGDIGLWRVVRTETIVGEPLLEAKRLNVSGSEVQPETNASWVLRGITSNERYVMRREKSEIEAKQQGLARPEATCAALIPLRKNAAWWELTQDERRSVFEEQSKHIQIGLKYLPAVARKLHHCRDLQSMRLSSTGWFRNCVRQRNGSTSSERWISVSCAKMSNSSLQRTAFGSR